MPVNTRHILFVAGGAFEELYDQVYLRVTKASGSDRFYQLVPGADGSLERRFVFEMARHVALEDIFNYGMTPQFLSRFAAIVILHDFTAPHLITIFRDIPGAIWPIAVDYFKKMGITLTITEEAVFLVADRAARENRLGARALNDVFGTIVKRLEFDPLASGLVREQDGQQVLEINRDMVEAALQV
jgi:ATP-dependent Clp protease ATP-binding subunit ClpX